MDEEDDFETFLVRLNQRRNPDHSRISPESSRQSPLRQKSQSPITHKSPVRLSPTKDTSYSKLSRQEMTRKLDEEFSLKSNTKPD